MKRQSGAHGPSLRSEDFQNPRYGATWQIGGESSVDRVIERVENKYWKIEVSDFKAWMLGFNKFTGEWETTEIGENEILITYTYTLHAGAPLLYPLNWLFARTFWRLYMKRVLENVRKLAYGDEPYQYP